MEHLGQLYLLVQPAQLVPSPAVLVPLPQAWRLHLCSLCVANGASWAVLTVVCAPQVHLSVGGAGEILVMWATGKAQVWTPVLFLASVLPV